MQQLPLEVMQAIGSSVLSALEEALGVKLKDIEITKIRVIHAED